MDSTTLTAGGVGAAIGGILILACDKGVPALLSLLNWRSANAKVQAEMAEKGYAFFIAKQDSRIEKLEAEVTDLEKRERACFENQVRQAAELSEAKRRVDYLEKKMGIKDGSDPKSPPGGNPA